MTRPPRWIGDRTRRGMAPAPSARRLFTRRGRRRVMSDSLVPRDHAEAVALFRAQVIGALTRSTLSRGELAAELRTLAARKYRPPRSRATKCYGASTLERWYYAYRHGGLAALRPDARADRGHARALTPAQRALVLDIRREYPGASAALILRTLE